jgi:hypothetical protein
LDFNAAAAPTRKLPSLAANTRLATFGALKLASSMIAKFTSVNSGATFFIAPA